MSQSAFEKLGSQLEMAIAAGQGGVWLQTREPDEVLRVLEALGKKHARNWCVGAWNLVEKLSWWCKKPPFNFDAAKPYLVLPLLADLLKLCNHRNTILADVGEKMSPDVTFVVVGLLLGHREVLNNQATNREVLASLLLTAIRGSTSCVTTVVLAHPSVQMPPELAEHYAIIEHELPDQDGRAEIIRSLNVEDESAVTMGAEVLSGLPAAQVVSICATSIAGYGELNREFLTTQKAKAVNKGGLLELYQGKQTFADLGGYKGLKTFCMQIIKGAKKVNLHAKGVLLVGVPGCLRGDTPVYDPIDGTTKSVEDRYREGRRFCVLARDQQGQPVLAQADPPKRFAPAPMLRFRLATGECFVVTHGHALWDGQQYSTASSIAEQHRRSVVCRLPSTSGNNLQELLRGARRYSRTVRGYQDDCSSDPCPCGGQPPQAVSIDQSSAPLPSDVQQRSRAACSKDGLDKEGTCNRPAQFLRRPMLGSQILRGMCTMAGLLFRLLSGRGISCVGKTPADRQPGLASNRRGTGRQPVAFAPRSTCVVRRGTIPENFEEVDLRVSGHNQGLLQSQIASGQTDTATSPLLLHQVEVVDVPWIDSCIGDTEQYIHDVEIVQVEDVLAEPYYDFHVPVFNNYWACGVWHHNTGKSFFAQVLGNELQRPTLALDIGKLYGGVIGATEGNVRSATDTIDAMAPNVFYVDECEKAFSGVGGGSHDSGVSDRMFGHFLTWMSNRTSDSFMVCTANRVEALPPEFSRSGRFDAVFFMDFPSKEQRNMIWQIHLKKYGHKEIQTPFPDDDNWTGAEIEDCCRLSRIRGVSLLEASESIVPIHRRYAQVINNLREWADGRCLDAETGKPFKSPGKFKDAVEAPTTRRRVNHVVKGEG